MALKNKFETIVIFCESCGGSGKRETHRGLENCSKCKGTGEVEVIQKKSDENERGE